MIANFGWKAAVAVAINAGSAMLLFHRELRVMGKQTGADVVPVPLTVVLVHLMFLLGVVVFAHHPAVFMGLRTGHCGHAVAASRNGLARRRLTNSRRYTRSGHECLSHAAQVGRPRSLALATLKRA